MGVGGGPVGVEGGFLGVTVGWRLFVGWTAPLLGVDGVGEAPDLALQSVELQELREGGQGLV